MYCWRSVPLPCGQYMAIFNLKQLQILVIKQSGCFLEMAGIGSLFFWQNVLLLWQSWSYWLREILGMLCFVWVFPFYIEFWGEISPFIFKLAGKQQRFSGDQRLWEAKAQRTVLPASQLSCRGKSKLISLPPKFFIPPPSYLIAQPNILTFFAPFLWNNTVLVHFSTAL